MLLIKKLGSSLFAAIFTLIIALILFAATSFLLTSDSKDIPLGFLLSGGLVSLSYFSTFILNKIDEKKEKTTYTLIGVTFKFMYDVACLFVLGFMYYYWDIKLFNIFTYVGVYTIGVICFALAHLIIAKKGE